MNSPRVAEKSETNPFLKEVKPEATDEKLMMPDRAKIKIMEN